MQVGSQHFAIRTADLAGSHRAFNWALAVLLVGINTGTTIVTFLMVFLIQYTQNRDARAMHLKVDELLRAVSSADWGAFAAGGRTYGGGRAGGAADTATAAVKKTLRRNFPAAYFLRHRQHSSS